MSFQCFVFSVPALGTSQLVYRQLYLQNPRDRHGRNDLGCFLLVLPGALANRQNEQEAAEID